MQAKHFKLQELVPPSIYYRRYDKAWELIDDRLIFTLDKLRERFGPTIINNWSSGGNRSQSGYRTHEHYIDQMPGETGEVENNKKLVEGFIKYSQSCSQHKYGRAADCLFTGVDAEEVRQYIYTNPHKFEYINGIERNVTWLHIDVRNSQTLKIF